MDHATMGQAFSRPGMDPRQWVSYGTVEVRGPDNGNNDPVSYPPEYGPLVNVVLQPSGISCPCRVLMRFAGDQEGEYSPLQSGDEVLVLIPEGDERAGPCIIGRLSNEIDKWPANVCGQDATKNLFAFERRRTPMMIETAGGWLVRSAGTGAFISLTQDGHVVISGGEKGYMSINPDFIGFQSPDGNVLLQLDLQGDAVVLQAKHSKLTIDDAASSMLGTGTFSVGMNGMSPYEHATSTEALVNVVEQVLTLLGAAFTGLGGSPTTGAALGALLNPGPLKVLINGALAAAGSNNTSAYGAAIAAALLQKVGAPDHPSVGCPGFMVG